MKNDNTSRIAPLWYLVVLLAVLAVACLGFVAWAGYDKWRTGAVTDEVSAEAAERDQVQELASQFVKEFHTYGPDDLEGNQLVGYDDRVSPLMTAKFQAAFEQGLAVNAGAVAQLSTRSAGDATAAGVASIDDDSAEVLVGGWVLLAYQHPDDPDEDVVGDRESVRYRVVLRQIEGDWLVDRLCNIDQAGQDAQCLGDDAVTEPPTGEVPDEGATETPAEPGDGGASPTEDEATEGDQ